MDVGFTRAGVHVVFANEMDADAAAAYCSNPDYLDGSVMRVGDITQILDDLPARGSADLVFGGPPCQGFSVAGKMDPDDARSKLVFTFMDVVERTRPRLFVMENVKALARLSRWQRVRDLLLKRAAGLGYGCHLTVLRATDFGVPQARERMFLVGVLGISPAQVEATLSRGLAALYRPAGTVREAISPLPRYGTPGNPATSTAEIRLARSPILRRTPYSGSLLFNGRGRPLDLDSVAKTLPAQMGGNHTPIIEQNLLDDPSSTSWLADYHRRLCRGEASPQTELVPDCLRRLTVREAAALQTFPEGFVFHGAPNKQYRQVGNAVPCKLAEAVATVAVKELLPLALPLDQVP